MKAALYILGGFFALLTLMATLSMAGGNPTAINGVLGAGFWTLFFAGFAIWCTVDDRRSARQVAQQVAQMKKGRP